MILFHTSLVYSSSTSNGNLRVPIQADKRKQKYLAIVLYHTASTYELLTFNIDNLLDYQKS